MVSSTISRLLFFGGRYLSLLLVARLLGADAADFLLVVAILEFFRIVFDYGLENSVLARLHQQSGVETDEFLRGKRAVRLVATLIGQIVTTGVVAVLCLRNDTPLAVPLLASLQFSCLMGFGYLQAHLQTGRPGGMTALIRPLIYAAMLQGALLVLAQHEMVPIWACTISYEFMALIACALVVRQFGHTSGAQTIASKGPNGPLSGFDFAAFRAVLYRIAPLGKVALIGVAYTRADVFAVSWVASGALLTQYLLYQRLASAPLMFFSTVASVSIPSLSDASRCVEGLPGKITRFRTLAYGASAASGVSLVVASPLFSSFFLLEHVDLKLLGMQGAVLALQISNGFHAALMIALQKSSRLWSIARNNTLLAAFLLPLCAWKLGALGVALALCIVEFMCAVQYVWLFHGSSRLGDYGYARQK